MVDREALGERLVAIVTDDKRDVSKTIHTVLLNDDEIWTIYNALIP